MDWLVGKIVGFGVPGLVLLIAMGLSGQVGAAAITAGLTTIGGSMLGGIFVLGLAGILATGISRYGFEAILVRTIEQFEKEGVSREEIARRIKSYPLSGDMKRKVLEKIEHVSYDDHKTITVTGTVRDEEEQVVGEVMCPECRKSNPKSFFTCMYCGSRLGEQPNER